MKSELSLNGPGSNKHISVGDRLQKITWACFASTMSTGAVAVTLAHAPYQFRGLETIGKIFFVVDLILFLTLSVLIVLRFALRPAEVLRSLRHPTEALFFGSFWVSIALILTCVESYALPACGPWLIKTLEICFWVYSGLVLLVAILQYQLLFHVEKLKVSDAMPTWILPIYPFLVLGTLSSSFIASQPQDAAVCMLVGGVMFQGLGWMVSIFIYVIYLIRLMSAELPCPPTRPSMFISVGPTGYTSAALVALGVEGQKILPGNFIGLSSIPAGEAVKVFGVFSGVFLWLLAFWFFSVALIAVFSDIRETKFTLSWWALIFPNGGLAIATVEIGDVLESVGIKAVACAMIILLVAAWLFVAVMNVRAMYRELMSGRKTDSGNDRND